MWKLVHASVAGTSHLSRGIPCQDACGAVTLEISGETVVLIALADGAGSAPRSQEGASYVVSEWLKQASVRLPQMESPDESTLRDLATAVRSHLLDHVAQLGGSASDFACTLLTAVLCPNRAIFFQIGDGAWVCQVENEYRCPIWPIQGEYVGETTFLTSPQFEKFYQTVSITQTMEAVAGLTDGMERLALKMNEKAPSPGFFKPIFSNLAAVATEQAEEHLKLFLSSARVNERTDDDKTLVLAIRIPLCENR